MRTDLFFMSCCDGLYHFLGRLLGAGEAISNFSLLRSDRRIGAGERINSLTHTMASASVGELVANNMNLWYVRNSTLKFSQHFAMIRQIRN